MDSIHTKEHAARSAHDNASSSTRKWIFWGFVAVAAFFLLTEHRAHLFGILPFLLVLLCPLMHLFHQHGSHREGQGGNAQDTSEGEPK